MMVFLYALFYIFALIFEQSKNKVRILLLVCIVLALMAGFRNPDAWVDTPAYLLSFNEYTNDLQSWSKDDHPNGYSEYGFYFLGVIIKTFTSSNTIYLLCIAALSFIFLYKDFKRYCYYPLLGVCAYIARFYLARNFIQIRAGLSYAIVLWAVQYITTRDWKRYFFWIFVAYQFHSSALIAVPLYFLCLLKLNKKQIFLGIILAFLIGGPGAGLVQSYVTDASSDLDVATTYVTEEYLSELGLRNPMIYFQLFFLWMYTRWESRLRTTIPDYYTIRTAYFYSTFILISMSVYTALSGRTSSMFSTLEMAIIPSIIETFNKRNRIIAYIGLGMGLTAIFYMNYYGH